VAKRTEMSGFVKPQLATLKSKAPHGDRWIHEIKFDGYRVQVHANRGVVKVYTRNGHDWTKTRLAKRRASRIALSLAALFPPVVGRVS
jgi:ATP-dependent DNA ligase